jgi:hypothetical protein
MMNLRCLALVSAIAILSNIALLAKSEAQTTQDVNFNGNILAAFTFRVGSPANPNPATGFNANPTSGKAEFTGTADVSISCITTAFISVSVPQRIAAPSGFDDTFRKARVRSGNRMTTAEVGSSTGFPGWSDSAPEPLSISSCTGDPLVMEMIAGSANAGSNPAGSYIYKVTVTATPQ